MPDFEIVTVTPDNLERYDLFCHKSRAKEEGYRTKVAWFKERFKEGFRIKLLRVMERKGLTSRGFIEYVPGEFAWRAVDAKGYMLIHCLWVVGRNKEKGYGTKLLERCIEDARDSDKKGVAVLAGNANWLPKTDFFLKRGFEKVDAAPPVFDLLVMKLKPAPDPSFPKDWDARLARYPKGLTIFFTRQCPYTEDATRMARDAAEKRGIPTLLVELKSSEDVQTLSPSAYGVFSMVYEGKLLSYHYLLEKDLAARLDEFEK